MAAKRLPALKLIVVSDTLFADGRIRLKKYASNQKETKHGGKREVAGRKPEGKERYTVTLTAENVERAKKREGNFSGLLDDLLSRWLKDNA